MEKEEEEESIPNLFDPSILQKLPQEFENEEEQDQYFHEVFTMSTDLNNLGIYSWRRGLTTFLITWNCFQIYFLLFHPK